MEWTRVKRAYGAGSNPGYEPHHSFSSFFAFS
jgi:hypothetical protein